MTRFGKSTLCLYHRLRVKYRGRFYGWIREQIRQVREFASYPFRLGLHTRSGLWMMLGIASCLSINPDRGKGPAIG